jgi:hypothetical protein
MSNTHICISLIEWNWGDGIMIDKYQQYKYKIQDNPMFKLPVCTIIIGNTSISFDKKTFNDQFITLFE